MVARRKRAHLFWCLTIAACLVISNISLLIVFHVPDARLHVEKYLGGILHASCRATLRVTSKTNIPVRVMFGANHKTGTLLAQRLVRMIAHGLNADYEDAPSERVHWEAARRRHASLFVLFRHSRLVSFYNARLINSLQRWVTDTENVTDTDAMTLPFPQRLRVHELIMRSENFLQLALSSAYDLPIMNHMALSLQICPTIASLISFFSCNLVQASHGCRLSCGPFRARSRRHCCLGVLVALIWR